MKMKIKKDMKMASEQAKYKKYCQFCGHTISFYAFEPDKKLCSWCGKYNYRNEKAEFRELLQRKIKEVEV